MLELDDYLLGFRMWRIDLERVEENSYPELFPMVVSSDTAWIPNTNQAHCRKDIHIGEDSCPSQSCDCGLYAYHKFDPVRKFAKNELVVYGAVRAFGKIEVHHSGWRSEFAEIVALKSSKFFDDEDLEKAYRVPVFSDDLELFNYSNTKATSLLNRYIPEKDKRLQPDKFSNFKKMYLPAILMIAIFFLLELISTKI